LVICPATAVQSTSVEICSSNKIGCLCDKAITIKLMMFDMKKDDDVQTKLEHACIFVKLDNDGDLL
jgi:hypothetical protein